MPKDFSRTDQLAAVMQRHLSQIIQHRLNDPRINQWVSITAVDITRDLSYAKVYVTSLDTDEDKKAGLIKALNGAAAFMRSVLSQELSIRKVPQLTFVYDTSIAYGNRLSRIIDDAVDSDQSGSEKK